jgi:enoyl-CoA hydratase
MVFTGKMISAAEAEQMGLANRVVSQDQLMEEVIKTAREIASKGKLSLRTAKEAINYGLNTDLATGIHIEIESFGMCYGSSDAKEGTSAFLEKRKAAFKGTLKD